MRKPLLSLYAALLALLFAAPAFASRPDLLNAIERARLGGTIDAGRAALYKLYEIKDPEKIPSSLTAGASRLAVPEGEDDHCATLPLLDVAGSLGSMDPETLALAREYLPERAPAGLPKSSALSSGAKLVSHMLPFRIETDNFSFEWGSELTNEDGTVPPRDDDSNGVPDVVELWASYFEHSYTQIRALGYNDAPTLDTYKITVLIANSDPTTSVDNLGASYYGLTNGHVPHPPGTEPAYIIVGNNLGAIVAHSPNDENDKSFLHGVHGAMMVTAAHELHHVFQFLYAPNAWANADTMNAINWYLEATSTWIEDEIYPFVNDYKQYFRSPNGWQRFPEMTLAIDWTRPLSQSVKVSRTYGSSIFNKYLSEHVGGALTVAEVWKGLKVGTSFEEAVGNAENTATGTSGSKIDDVFLGFAAANATMDYDDGALYGITPRVNRSTPAATPLPEILGSILADNGTQTPAAKTLSLSNLAPANRWGVAAVASLDAVDAKYDVVVAAKGTSATIVPPDASELTTLAAYFGPNLTTTSVAMNLGSGVASDTTPPSQVGGLLVQDVQTGFEAEWNAATDDVKTGGYIVQYRAVSDAKWFGRTILAPVRRASVRGLLPDTDYYVRVVAFDSTGNLGAPSTSTQVRTGPAYGYPAPIVFNLSLPPQIDPIGDKSVVEGQTLAFTVTASDPDTPAGSLVFDALQMPSGATFNQSTHAFSWTPTITQSGTYSVAFTVYDGATSVWENVKITVIDANPSSSGSGSAGGCFIDALNH